MKHRVIYPKKEENSGENPPQEAQEGDLKLSRFSRFLLDAAGSTPVT